MFFNLVTCSLRFSKFSASSCLSLLFSIWDNCKGLLSYVVFYLCFWYLVFLILPFLDTVLKFSSVFWSRFQRISVHCQFVIDPDFPCLCTGLIEIHSPASKNFSESALRSLLSKDLRPWLDAWAVARRKRRSGWEIKIPC